MTNSKNLNKREHSLFTSTISGEKDGEVQILGKPLTEWAANQSYPRVVISLLLGRELKSPKTEALVDLALKLLVDHGPYQSGPVNTIIAARAGKDLVSSLTAGLLTIGSRFGGALNSAAKVWFEGVNNRSEPVLIVENFASRKEYLPGIGHKKYRLEIPDPRVVLFKQQGEKLKQHCYLDYALEVEKLTTAKKPNLILNVDGCLAAVLLDFLVEEEHYSKAEIAQLITAEFFNALFVLSRSVGLVSHYLDQKRLNEPLFRLDPTQVLSSPLK
jgi:ATP citrate (pro-S)-lyase